jgi:formylmethanofuran dehydrogenase subunit C
MSGYRLTLKQAGTLRIDMRGITPSALAGATRGDAERLRIGVGNAMLPLAEMFDVAQGGDDGCLVLSGELSHCDRIGWQMNGGRIVVEGSVGDYVGGGMTGGEITVEGNAGALAACEMAGGKLVVKGDVGAYAASTLPGSMDGMRGGVFIVEGSAGERFGDRMRRGTALIHGNAGDFLASRMVAGTIALGGTAGAHAGHAMHRGSIVFAGTQPEVPKTFVPALVDAAVFWQLLSRDLARLGGPFAELPGRHIERHLGDLAANGKGELIFAR